MGATGWVRKRPVTKQLKSGETVLLVDLEDENSARLRLVCSASAKDRYTFFFCQNAVIPNGSYVPLLPECSHTKNS